MSEGRRTPVSRNIAIFRSLAEIPAGFGPSVAAIGNFDGRLQAERAVAGDHDALAGRHAIGARQGLQAAHAAADDRARGAGRAP